MVEVEFEGNVPTVILGVLAVVTGIAASVLSVSAFVTLLPVLLTAFGYSAIDALFLCLMVDSINGFFVFLRYYSKLGKAQTVPVMAGLAISTSSALLLAFFFGIDFIEEQGETIKGGANLILIIIAFVFLRKGIKMDRDITLEDRVVVEVPEIRHKADDLNEPIDTFERDVGMIVDDPPAFPCDATCRKEWCLGFSLFRLFEFCFLVGTGAFGGLFGFGGGNAFAMLYILVYGWDTVPSAGAAGFISGAMTLSLAILFVSTGASDPNVVKDEIYVALPCDLIALVVTTSFAVQLSEKTITIFIGVMLVLLVLQEERMADGDAATLQPGPEAVVDATAPVTMGSDLADFYNKSATTYASMMDDEMAKYVGDFDKAMATIPPGTAVLDTCFGSGHMLAELHRRDPSRKFSGIDLSPAMLEEAKKRIGGFASLRTGDMLDVSAETDASFGLVINCFAAHHVSADLFATAVKEYARLLVPGGCLYLAVWEGEGKIEYGGIQAVKHSRGTVQGWIDAAGLTQVSIREAFEEEMGMNTCFVLAQAPQPPQAEK
ncbi:Hypothetical protein SCF082_LOCUS13642 [Durusdinium trenchii]|uniref:Methyltransferase domain-containing protein n=1 Tax=Durusdinium trenchii TaxID=1381693 RepID=A0ABP0JSL0_9DINO